jgi:type III restriction enzyme
LKNDAELHNVLANQSKAIAENINAQMSEHYYYKGNGESEVVISQGFTPLKSSAVNTSGEVKPLHWSPDDKRTISQYVYGGFSRCAYDMQKFHSDTE